MQHPREHHLIGRSGWLRAAVLGANDGILSVSSLLVGVAASPAGRAELLIAGAAALVAGAMSMAAGEYVSVSSQSDIEAADLAKERAEIAAHPEAERRELAGMYMKRGVEPALAMGVATQLMARDALGAHARDELGITEMSTARPLQAAAASGASFTAGALPPLALAALLPRGEVGAAIAVASIVLLAVLGAVGARAGGARTLPAVLRVVFWGAAAMLVTAGVGRLVGRAV